jgi:citronellyl-CoA dehydrogenase
MQFTPEHEQISDTVRKFVANEINPFTAEWEKAGIFPAHEVFKKLGDLGLLGIKYPTEYGGMGLDFSYSMVMAEALGDCNAAACPWPSACRPTCAPRPWPLWLRRAAQGVSGPGHCR